MIEHIAHDAGFLRAVSTILIAITVPALPSLFSVYDTVVGHFSRYTRAWPPALMLVGDFEPLRVSYFMVAPLLPLLLLRTLPSRLGQRRAVDRAQDRR